MKVCIVCAIHKFGLPPEHPNMDRFYISTCQHCGRNRSVIELPRKAEQQTTTPTAGEAVGAFEQLAASWRKRPPKNPSECTQQLEDLVKRWSPL